jgi:hypothetical protein
MFYYIIISIIQTITLTRVYMVGTVMWRHTDTEVVTSIQVDPNDWHIDDKEQCWRRRLDLAHFSLHARMHLECSTGLTNSDHAARFHDESSARI